VKSSEALKLFESFFDVEPAGVENLRIDNRFDASHRSLAEPSRATGSVPGARDQRELDLTVRQTLKPRRRRAR
jgi:hypothetical protein